MASLGYGSGACAFAAVEGLDDQALFLLVEGSTRLSDRDRPDSGRRAGTRTAARFLRKPGRAFGRSVVAFRDFDAMLDDGQTSRSWALLAAPLENRKRPEARCLGVLRTNVSRETFASLFV
ncbi:MAG: hypothetical protein ACLUW6_09300 [Coriobacteriaceae bacterium]